MHPPFKTIVVALIAVVCLRIAPVARGAAEDSVSLEFSIFAWGARTPSLKYGPKQTVDGLDPFTRSDARRYSGPAVVKFFPAGARPTGPGEPPPEPVATVELPRGARKVTLLMAPAGRGRYRMFAVPEDGDALPEQSVRFYNFTASTLAVAFGKDGHVELSSQGTALIHPRGGATVIQVARLSDGRWRRLFNNVAKLNASGRQNIIFAPNGESPVAMHTLPPWPRPESADVASARRPE